MYSQISIKYFDKQTYPKWKHFQISFYRFAPISSYYFLNIVLYQNLMNSQRIFSTTVRIFIYFLYQIRFIERNEGVIKCVTGTIEHWIDVSIVCVSIFQNNALYVERNKMTLQYWLLFCMAETYRHKNLHIHTKWPLTELYYFYLANAISICFSHGLDVSCTFIPNFAILIWICFVYSNATWNSISDTTLSGTTWDANQTQYVSFITIFFFNFIFIFLFTV